VRCWIVDHDRLCSMNDGDGRQNEQTWTARWHRTTENITHKTTGLVRMVSESRKRARDNTPP